MVVAVGPEIEAAVNHGSTVTQVENSYSLILFRCFYNLRDFNGNKEHSVPGQFTKDFDSNCAC